MGYREALEAAGAKVITMEEFGSYQGDWWAKIEYAGKIGWVTGSYGSCSGCDSFESEFGYESHTCNGEAWYNALYNGFRDNCEICSSLKEKLSNFGKSYLDEILSNDEAIREASRHIEWDSDAKLMVDFIKNNT